MQPYVYILLLLLLLPPAVGAISVLGVISAGRKPSVNYTENTQTYNAVHFASNAGSVATTQNYFDNRMTFYLKNLYDNQGTNIRLINWQYESKSTGYKYLNKTNQIVICLSDGQRSSISVDTNDVWGKFCPNEEEIIESTTLTNDDFYIPGEAEKWLSANASSIENAIAERKKEGSLRFLYPVEKDYLDHIEEIARLLETNTGNTVLVSDDSLFIDAQVSVEM